MFRTGVPSLACAVVVAGCAAAPLGPPPEIRAAAARDAAPPAERFHIEWSASETTKAEVDAVSARAEAAYARFRTLLGPRGDERAIVIRLAGDAARGQYPLVSPETGDIILYRFPGNGGGYEASLAHEIVHALRWKLWTDPAKQTDPFLFWEEGLAEILATEAGFPSSGFPTYGRSVAIAAGAWIATNEDLPLTDLLRHHRALNLRCMAQSYGLRLSFMTYVRERFGLEKMIALAYVEEPLTEDTIARALGATLDDTATAWKTWARARLDASERASEQIETYRTQTPIRFFPKCTGDDIAPRR